MNDERSQILERLQAQADELLGQTPTLFAYGIADPGEFPALRDVHLAAYMEPGLPPESYFHVEIRLETLLEEALAVPAAGARILNGAPLTFQGAVLTAGRAIYSRDEGSRIAFEERVRALGDLSSPDPIKEVAGRYALQSAITSCLAVCLHLASALKLRPPRDFIDIPEVLAEIGLLEGDVARELARLIGIRNQLVHDPAEGDPTLFEGLPGHLASLDRFAHAVRERLQK
ncbi:MAG: hypothetical protein XU15_C0008G0069 [candidate division NC10 bacterium CSP1-5]|nr:MAG: hypothetical protein XU15_C0008G0069 [candidate division NC10 bacterium CSP1-5]